jgi:hypothetical protein
MKILSRILPILLAVPLIGFAAPDLNDLQNELALIQAKLTLAEAKLALAKKEGELTALSQAAKPAEKPSEQAAPSLTEKPALTPEETRKNLFFKRNLAVFEVKATEDKIIQAKASDKPEEKKEIPALETTLTSQKVAVALAETALNSFDKAQALIKADEAEKPAAEHAAKASLITADAVQALVKDDLDKTLLRKYGFGINLGYGYLSKLKQSTPTVMVRYNFLHRLHETEEGERRMERMGRKSNRDLPPRQKKFLGSQLNDISGWIGYTPGKFDSPDGTAKESPILGGLAIGLGHGPDYSSAVSIDVGVAFFNNPKFKSTSLYLGVSTDVTVYKAIFKSMADAIN